MRQIFTKKTKALPNERTVGDLIKLLKRFKKRIGKDAPVVLYIGDIESSFHPVRVSFTSRDLDRDRNAFVITAYIERDRLN